MYPNPYASPNIIRQGLQFLKSIQWGSILEGTGKTLGVINQAIPIIYQVKPLLGNAKTLLKIANGIQEEPVADSRQSKKEENSNNSPIFYI